MIRIIRGWPGGLGAAAAAALFSLMAGDRMIEWLIARFTDDEFNQRSRANYLVWFLLIAMPLMTVLSVTLYLINRDEKAFATIPGVGVGWLFMAIVLYLLRTGRYAAASYTFAAIFNLVVAVLTVNEYNTMPALALSGIGWFSLVCIVSTVLFCPPRAVIGAAIVHIAARTYTFIDLARTGASDMNMVSTNFGDGVVAIILVSILAILTVKMLTRSSDKIAALLIIQENENKVLVEVLETVTRSSSVLKEQADHMLGMARKFSDEVQTQAASTEESSAAMEELAASSQGIAEKSSKQRATLETAYAKMQDLTASMHATGVLMEKAMTARQSANQLIDAMKGLMDKTMTDMKAATGSAASMQAFSDVIKSISDNISLLSLNAAIEAARAGETGKGFAVVADQVGRLSEQTMEQTDSITEHANQLERVMKDASGSLAGAIKAMGEVIGHVASFGEYVGEVAAKANGLIMINRDIQEEIQAIKNNSDEITVATQEQNRAAREVSSTIERINEATQHISGATNDIIDYAHQLSSLASELTASADLQRTGQVAGVPGEKA